MRKFLGVLLLLVGIPILAAGVAASVIVGPDDTATTGPHRLSSDGVAIATIPEVMAYVGPTLHLSVRSTGGGPVFLGVGPEVDVQSYLGAASYREVSDVVLPWKVTSIQREAGGVAGATGDVAPPADQGWWLASVHGDGTQSLTWPLRNGRYEIVALNEDASAGVNLQVTMGLELAGAFYATLAVAGLGLLLTLLGLLLLLWRRLRRTPRPPTASTVIQPVAPPVADLDTALVTRIPPAPPYDAAPTPVTAVAAPTVAAVGGLSATAAAAYTAERRDPDTETTLVTPALPDPMPAAPPLARELPDEDTQAQSLFAAALAELHPEPRADSALASAEEQPQFDAVEAIEPAVGDLDGGGFDDRDPSGGPLPDESGADRAPTYDDGHLVELDGSDR